MPQISINDYPADMIDDELENVFKQDEQEKELFKEYNKETKNIVAEKKEKKYDSEKLEREMELSDSLLSARFKDKNESAVIVGVYQVDLTEVDMGVLYYRMTVSPGGEIEFDDKEITITKKDAKKIIEQKIEEAQDILSKLKLALSYVNK